MNQHRSIGVFAIACASICFIIAVERYYSAVATAKEFANRIEGVDFVSAGVPNATYLAGFAGVVLLVVGVMLLFEAWRKHSNRDELIGDVSAG